MAQPIKIKFSYKQLEALNEGWQILKELHAYTAKEKAMLSAMEDLAIKFETKQIKLQYKYDPSSDYSISLKAYQAYFLEMFWRDAYKQLPLGYSRTIMNAKADYLNQKLA